MVLHRPTRVGDNSKVRVWERSSRGRSSGLYLATIFAFVFVILTGCSSNNDAFPGPGRVGVPEGTKLTPSGPVVANVAGQVIENLDVSGSIEVTAPDVVIRNCRITGSGAYGVLVSSGSATITDSEIAGSFENGIGFGNWTAERVDIHGTIGDGVKVGDNVRLADSWIHKLAPAPGAHADGVQIQGGVVNVVIEGNWIDMAIPNANAAIFIAPDLGPSSPGPVTVRNNHVDGGNFTMYVVDGNNGEFVISDITVSDNVFGRNYTYGPMNVNVPVSLSGNRYSDGEPIT